jgi:hypothetical protein
MIASNSLQDQIATLMADVMPEKILHFKFSPSIQKRIESLIEQKKLLFYLLKNRMNSINIYQFIQIKISRFKPLPHHRL